MIDLFPDMPLETRAYILLSMVGVIFFAAIVVLGVGNALQNLKTAKSYDLTNVDDTPEPVKAKKEKKVKAEKPAKPEKEKKPLFGRKKEEPIEVLAIPAGYQGTVVEEEEILEEVETEPYIPTVAAGEAVDDDDLPDDWLTSNAQDDDDDWNTRVSNPNNASRPNGSSPFGGGVKLDSFD